MLQYNLKWNSYIKNMMDVFKDLLSNELMVDVTLACDGLSLKAHKIILSACSPFFKSLFLENPCKHPIVILKDMKYNELKNIIEFIYNGEVNVPEDQLNCFLKSADTLKIKGLAEYSNKNFTYTSIEEPSDITVHHNEVLTTTKCNTDCANKQTFNNFNHTDNVQEIKTVPVTVGIEPISADITKQLADVQPGISQEPQTEGLLSNKKEFELSSTNSSENALTVNDLSNARKIIRRSLSLDAEIQMKHQNDNSHKSIPSEDLSPNHQPQSPLEIKSDELELDSPMSPVAGPSHNMADSMMIDQSSIPSHPDISFQQCVDLVSQDSMQGTASIIRTIYYSKNPLVDDEVTTINEELPKLKKKWKYKCFKCSLMVASKGHLDIHMRTHTGERPFSCHLCGKTTIRQHDLQLHMRTHTGVKPYACPICSMKFNNSSNYRRHYRRRHPTAERILQACKLCHEEFESKELLSGHLINQHSVENTHICVICQKSYKRLYDLKTHLRVHSKEKPYACRICFKLFTYKSNQIRHIRQNHPKSIKSAACMASKLDEDPDYIPESGN